MVALREVGDLATAICARITCRMVLELEPPLLCGCVRSYELGIDRLASQQVGVKHTGSVGTGVTCPSHQFQNLSSSARSCSCACAWTPRSCRKESDAQAPSSSLHASSSRGMLSSSGLDWPAAGPHAASTAKQAALNMPGRRAARTSDQGPARAERTEGWAGGARGRGQGGSGRRDHMRGPARPNAF
eukprot:CAMPEP_0198513892 /NCGR_PEP_ID=MMETSP1462-20131121/16348_1 /TAXON_ID=1333877 /ORGANISM="Brandtodinium nutriculum, Strain RCC3387" /LENGTH=186 /DNA_ID=CAMNT_0044243325 /DNA_START=541 /DNA_END=1099 /DNA_ORIENTATION=+